MITVVTCNEATLDKERRGKSAYFFDHNSEKESLHQRTCYPNRAVKTFVVQTSRSGAWAEKAVRITLESLFARSLAAARAQSWHHLQHTLLCQKGLSRIYKFFPTYHRRLCTLSPGP